MESIKNLHEIASMLDPEILVSPPRLVDVSKYASTNTTVEVSFTVSIPPEKGVKPLPQWLIEAARAEEDERLGRWRWPENPDVVVYRDGGPSRRSVTIFFEKTGGIVIGMAEKFLVATSDDGHESRKAARAYFDAHPEPKPWHEAKPGELWALTVNGVESAWAFRVHEWERVSDGYLLAAAPNSPAIDAGRRIWPPEESS